MRDFVLEVKLALLEPLNLDLIVGRALEQVVDHRTELAVFLAKLEQPLFHAVFIGHRFRSLPLSR